MPNPKPPEGFTFQAWKALTRTQRAFVKSQIKRGGAPKKTNHRPPPGYDLDAWKALTPRERKNKLRTSKPKIKKERVRSYDRCRPAPGYSPEVWLELTKAQRELILYRIKHPVRRRVIIPDGYKREYWDTLSYDEKRKLRDRVNNEKRGFVYNAPGSMDRFKYCTQLLANMTNATRIRGHDSIQFTLNDLIRMSEICTRYIIDETRGFDLIWSNGLFNSVSCQRIDDSIGYNVFNVVMYPAILNSRRAFRYHDLLKMTEMISNDTSDEIKNEWIEQKWPRNNYNGMKIKCESETTEFRKLEFDFTNPFETTAFLKDLFIQQGGLCAYSKAPMRLICNSPFTVSVERRDPIKGYTRDNIVLICDALNGAVNGLHRSISCSKKLRHLYGTQLHIDAVEKAKFNQDYWDKSMGITPIIKARIEEIIRENRSFLQRAFNGDLKRIKLLRPHIINNLDAKIRIKNLSVFGVSFEFTDKLQLADYLKCSVNDKILHDFIVQKLPVFKNYIVVESEYPVYRDIAFPFDVTLLDVVTNQQMRFNTLVGTYVYLVQCGILDSNRDNTDNLIKNFKWLCAMKPTLWLKRFKVITYNV